MAFLQLDQAWQIYYELIEGEAEKPWLVFLHEGLGCTAMWKDFPRRLCRETGCPGIVYDRRGYGRSSPLARPWTIGYLHEYARAELPEVIAQLLPGKNYFLIGHSDGGSIALIHAAEKPARLRGVITEAAHVFVEPLTLDGIRATLNNYRAGLLTGLAAYHGENTEAIFAAWSGTWLGASFRSWNIEDLLPSLACPVLVLQGAGDQYGTARQVEAIAARVPDARQALVAGCGHTPHREKPATVLRLMQEFLTPRLAPRGRE